MNKYQFKVLGEGTVRAKGALAFVLPQALDLVGKSSYVASISEWRRGSVPGVLHLRRTAEGVIEAEYIVNPCHFGNVEASPAWLQSINSLSTQLGKEITWRQPQPT